MEIKASTQSVDGPPDKPEVENPVKVTLDLPVYYMTERGPLLSKRAIFCGKAFADTVLTELNAILGEAQCGLLHLGCYNPRKARKKDGTPILPARWSNHAYGEAVDFKGVVRSNDPDDYLDIAGMKRNATNLLAKIQARCAAAIETAERKPEIVDEGGWLHIGIWPRNRPQTRLISTYAAARDRSAAMALAAIDRPDQAAAGVALGDARPDLVVTGTMERCAVDLKRRRSSRTPRSRK